MKRTAFTKIELREFDESKREFQGVATTIGTDRYGDVVESDGAEYALPLPLLWQHNAREPVGHVLEVKPSSKALKVTGSIAKLDAPGPLKDRLDEAWHSLKLGLVRHLSIGFNPKEWEPLDEKNPWGGMHFLKWEWLELSLVTIPANADAAITSVKSIHSLRDLTCLDRDLRAAASGKSHAYIPGVPLVQYGSSGVSGHTTPSAGQRKAVSLIRK
jgi:HK97 family phage prohead protease